MPNQNNSDVLQSLTYVPPVTQYNGVLILLREPNDPQKKKKPEYLRDNALWFRDVIAGKCLSDEWKDSAYRNRAISRYGNRFREMLKAIDSTETLRLESVVFGNINIEGGGDFVGVNYGKTDKAKRLEDILRALSTCGYTTRHAFVCLDLFQLIIKEKDTDLLKNEGFIYSNGKRMSKAVRGEIVYYEMLHPSRSPRIMYDFVSSIK